MKVKVTACKCERCSWVWLPRGYPKIRTSKKCPSCGSYYWDTPRRKPKIEPPELQAKEKQSAKNRRKKMTWILLKEIVLPARRNTKLVMANGVVHLLTIRADANTTGGGCVGN